MLRRDLLKSSVTLAGVAELGLGKAHGFVRPHNQGAADKKGEPEKSSLVHQDQPTSGTIPLYRFESAANLVSAQQ